MFFEPCPGGHRFSGSGICRLDCQGLKRSERNGTWGPNNHTPLQTPFLALRRDGHGLSFRAETAHLGPAEYKAVYNGELKALVGRRLSKLDRGELAIGDFTVKGAVPFLRALKKAGLRLYLASGTDEADVQQEAERLGYAEVFDGGIFGSIGQVAQDAKKMVIERILRDIGSERGQLIAFGDGPVEVRETVRRGSYAVGVASDEVRRFGLNLEKRARLIRSGAHVVVPDFSQWESLWTLLRLAKPEPR